ELEAILDDCLTRFQQALSSCSGAGAQLTAAGEKLYLHDYQGAGQNLLTAGGHLSTLSNELHSKYGFFAYYILDAVWWINDNWPEAPEPAELTMAAILDAMEKALPHEPLLFVAYLEAFKASAWDATFDERFFADLVKKWKIWG
ncbi:unnamed protein product, partial [marine sediment metagenome]